MVVLLDRIIFILGVKIRREKIGDFIKDYHIYLVLLLNNISYKIKG